MASLKRTPLFAAYKDQAKLVEFGGWEMPVQFSSIKEEHHAVRNAAGLFDVSHMGEVAVTGPDATTFLQRIMTNDVDKLQDNQAQYTFMCYPDGGTIDDLLVYKKGENDYLLVPNAANLEKDVAWLNKHRSGDVTIHDVSPQTALLALQGPKAEAILQQLTSIDLSGIRPFRFYPKADVDGLEVMISRSGYTGEDGFELYLAAEDSVALWEKLLAAGKEDGLLPCGLGARDTLRFEAKLPLYGQELSANISPLEAGLGFAVKLDKGEFIGRDALLRQKEQGIPRKLVGIEMIERGIPRTNYPVYVGDELIGEVTSGTQSPTLQKNLGLALIKREYGELGQEVQVGIRKKRVQAQIVKTPFYKRSST